jgi:hypothetical protein
MSRLSVGTGFFGPTPITEETEAAGLTRLGIRRPLEPERGLSTSFDVSRTDGPCHTRPPCSRLESVIHSRRTLFILRTQHPAGSDHERRSGAPGHMAPRAILGNRQLHLRESAGNRQRRSTGCAAHPAAQRRPRGHVGSGGRGPSRHRVVLHGHTEPRRESLPRDERVVHDSWIPRGKTVRAHSPLRERREPHWSQADAMGSAAPPHTRSTAAGPSMRGRRSRVGTSTVACAFVSRNSKSGVASCGHRPVRLRRP